MSRRACQQCQKFWINGDFYRGVKINKCPWCGGGLASYRSYPKASTNQPLIPIRWEALPRTAISQEVRDYVLEKLLRGYGHVIKVQGTVESLTIDGKDYTEAIPSILIDSSEPLLPKNGGCYSRPLSTLVLVKSVGSKEEDVVNELLSLGLTVRVVNTRLDSSLPMMSSDNPAMDLMNVKDRDTYLQVCRISDMIIDLAEDVQLLYQAINWGLYLIGATNEFVGIGEIGSQEFSTNITRLSSTPCALKDLRLSNRKVVQSFSLKNE